jgi:hypothetical protein
MQIFNLPGDGLVKAEMFRRDTIHDILLLLIECIVGLSAVYWYTAWKMDYIK